MSLTGVALAVQEFSVKRRQIISQSLDREAVPDPSHAGRAKGFSLGAVPKQTDHVVRDPGHVARRRQQSGPAI